MHLLKQRKTQVRKQLRPAWNPAMSAAPDALRTPPSMRYRCHASDTSDGAVQPRRRPDMLTVHRCQDRCRQGCHCSCHPNCNNHYGRENGLPVIRVRSNSKRKQKAACGHQWANGKWRREPNLPAILPMTGEANATTSANGSSAAPAAAAE